MAIDGANRIEHGLMEHGFVDFRAAGTVAAGEFRCAECGYGAVVHRELPPCPMCGGSVWERTQRGFRGAVRLQ